MIWKGMLGRFWTWVLKIFTGGIKLLIREHWEKVEKSPLGYL